MELKKEQELLLNKMSNGGERMLIIAPPRFGKAFTTIAYFNKIGCNGNILIVSKGRNNLDDWKRQITSLLNTDAKITYSTYIYLPKISVKSPKFDIIILDEIHNITKRSIMYIDRLLQHNPIVIGMTATPPRNNSFESYKNSIISETLKLKEVFNMGIKESINRGLNKDFSVFLFSFDIEGNYVINYISYTLKLKKAFGTAKKWAAIRRMKYIQNLGIRRRIAKATIKGILANKDNKLLIFASSIEEAKIYGNDVHSNNTEKLNNKRILDFNNNKIRYLTSVAKLKEGINFTDVSHILLTSVNSDYKEQLQKIGRALNTLTNKNDKVNVIVLVAKNTVEMNWFSKAFPYTQYKEFNAIEYLKKKKVWKEN